MRTNGRMPQGFMRRQMIVLLSILFILSLMFVPNFLNVRFGESENKVKSILRTVYEAAELYQKLHRPAEYPAHLDDMTSEEPPIADKSFLAEEQKGYRFRYDRIRSDKFRLTAKPIVKYVTGYHSFYIDETGIIRLNNAEGDPIDA